MLARKPMSAAAARLPPRVRANPNGGEVPAETYGWVWKAGGGGGGGPGPGGRVGGGGRETGFRFGAKCHRWTGPSPHALGMDGNKQLYSVSRPAGVVKQEILAFLPEVDSLSAQRCLSQRRRISGLNLAAILSGRLPCLA